MGRFCLAEKTHLFSFDFPPPLRLHPSQIDSVPTSSGKVDEHFLNV